MGFRVDVEEIPYYNQITLINSKEIPKNNNNVEGEKYMKKSVNNSMQMCMMCCMSVDMNRIYTVCFSYAL